MQLIFDRGGERRGARSTTPSWSSSTGIPRRRPAAGCGRNFVTSLDGSVQGPDGRSGSINTASDHHVFALHRALADAVVVGAGTARTEGYRAVDLAPWQQAIRQAGGSGAAAHAGDHHRLGRSRPAHRHRG